MITRRLFSFGLLAAPAIIRPGLLMPIKPSRVLRYDDEGLKYFREKIMKDIDLVMDAQLERIRVEIAIAFQIPQRYLFGTIGVGDRVTGLGIPPGSRIVSVGSA